MSESQSQDQSLSATEIEAKHRSPLDERDSFQDELVQTRKTLEEIQAKHETELADLQGQLAAARIEKEQAEGQYRGLLGKVSTIRSQLGERLKADAVSPIGALGLPAAHT